MGQQRDGPGRLGRGVTVVEVRDADHGRPHQRAVARRAARAGVHLLRRTADALGGRTGPAGRGTEHRAGLDPDVAGSLADPLQEPGRHGVERGLGAQVVGRAGAGDHDRHLGVVAPLTRCVGAEPAADHPRRSVRAGRELVRHAERVAARLAEQHPRDPVLPPVRTLHVLPLLVSSW